MFPSTWHTVTYLTQHSSYIWVIGRNPRPPLYTLLNPKNDPRILYSVPVISHYLSSPFYYVGCFSLRWRFPGSGEDLYTPTWLCDCYSPHHFRSSSSFISACECFSPPITHYDCGLSHFVSRDTKVISRATFEWRRSRPLLFHGTKPYNWVYVLFIALSSFCLVFNV